MKKKERDIFKIAKAAGRDYVTPEDIGDAIAAGCSKVRLWRDVLFLLGETAGFGAEDRGLCAFVAHRFKPKRKRRTPAPRPSGTRKRLRS